MLKQKNNHTELWASPISSFNTVQLQWLWWCGGNAQGWLPLADSDSCINVKSIPAA